MATSSSGLFGDFSGKIGNLVVYQMNGKTIVRTRPSVKHKAATGKRKQYQEDFSFLMKLMQATSDYIKIGFKELAVNSTTFRKALSSNLKKYRGLQRPSGLEWLDLSIGERAGVQNFAVSLLTETKIKYKWGEAEAGLPFDKNDAVMAMVLNTKTLLSTKIFYSARRENYGLEIDAPPFEDVEDLFCFLTLIKPNFHTKADLKNISNSQCAVIKS